MSRTNQEGVTVTIMIWNHINGKKMIQPKCPIRNNQHFSSNIQYRNIKIVLQM